MKSLLNQRKKQSLNPKDEKIKEKLEDIDTQLNSLNERRLEYAKLNDKIMKHQKA